MKKKILICVLSCFIFGLCGCGIKIGEEKSQPNEQQIRCEHEYVEIDWSVEYCVDGSNTSHDIYCPKCQWETTVSHKEWNKIQADMDYEEKDDKKGYEII